MVFYPLLPSLLCRLNKGVDLLNCHVAEDLQRQLCAHICRKPGNIDARYTRGSVRHVPILSLSAFAAGYLLRKFRNREEFSLVTGKPLCRIAAFPPRFT